MRLGIIVYTERDGKIFRGNISLKYYGKLAESYFTFTTGPESLVEGAELNMSFCHNESEVSIVEGIYPKVLETMSLETICFLNLSYDIIKETIETLKEKDTRKVCQIEQKIVGVPEEVIDLFFGKD